MDQASSPSHVDDPVEGAEAEEADEASAKKRPRYNPADEALEEILTKYIRKPTTIQYLDDGIQSKVLKDNGLMLIALENIQANCSFSQSDMKTALLNVATAKEKKWKLQGKAKDSFADKVATKIRLMCQHFNTGSRNRKKPGWVKEIRALAGQQGCDEVVETVGETLAEAAGDHECERAATDEDSDNSEAERETPRQKVPAVDASPEIGCAQDSAMLTDTQDRQHDAWSVMWDPMCFTAYRKKEMEDPPEFAEKIICTDEMADTTPIIAVWTDNFRCEVAAMTCRGWRAHLSSNSQSRAAANLWADEEYVIKGKADRYPLIYIAKVDDTDKQLCQLREDSLPEKAKVVDIMKQVVQEMKRDPGEDPYTFRNNILSKLGIPFRKKGKKSAAALQTDGAR